MWLAKTCTIWKSSSVKASGVKLSTFSRPITWSRTISGAPIHEAGLAPSAFALPRV